MTIDPLALAPELDAATARLLTTVAGMSEAQLGEPSLLPGWTRGHVLSHLCRQADALVNVLTWARTGVETPPYASPEARARGIEAGAYRPLDEQIEDLRQASATLVAAISDMPADKWPVVLPGQGAAAKVVWRRLREVEMHHIDLDLGYTPADWPEAFTHRLIHELVTDRPRSSGNLPAIGFKIDGIPHVPPMGEGEPTVVVSGAAFDVAAWLAGRSDGAALTVTPDSPLPTLSDWM